jgi:hypothetical protein
MDGKRKRPPATGVWWECREWSSYPRSRLLPGSLLGEVVEVVDVSRGLGVLEIVCEDLVGLWVWIDAGHKRWRVCVTRWCGAGLRAAGSAGIGSKVFVESDRSRVVKWLSGR